MLPGKGPGLFARGTYQAICEKNVRVLQKSVRVSEVCVRVFQRFVRELSAPIMQQLGVTDGGGHQTQ